MHAPTRAMASWAVVAGHASRAAPTARRTITTTVRTMGGLPGFSMRVIRARNLCFVDTLVLSPVVAIIPAPRPARSHVHRSVRTRNAVDAVPIRAPVARSHVPGSVLIRLVLCHAAPSASDYLVTSLVANKCRVVTLVPPYAAKIALCSSAWNVPLMRKSNLLAT